MQPGPCFFLSALTLILLMVMSGCSLFKHQDHWEPYIGPQEIYTDAPVFRDKPIISLQPANVPTQPMTAMFFSVQVTQPMDKPLVLGRALGRMLWQTWTQARVFPTFVYEEESAWPGLAQALALARARGVDLIIRGEVPYFLSGGAQGTTSLSIFLEIYEAQSGQRIWSMKHAGRMEPRPRRDFIVAFHQRRLPEEPVYAIMTVLTCDLAGYVGMWNNGWDTQLICPLGPREK